MGYGMAHCLRFAQTSQLGSAALATTPVGGSTTLSSVDDTGKGLAARTQLETKRASGAPDNVEPALGFRKSKSRRRTSAQLLKTGLLARAYRWAKPAQRSL